MLKLIRHLIKEFNLEQYIPSKVIENKKESKFTLLIYNITILIIDFLIQYNE